MRLDEKAQERFATKYEVVESGCWQWLDSLATFGYGTFGYKGKGHRAHRISYMLYKGEIPDGLVLDHLCRNRGCVNPDHLEPVTTKENVMRGIGVAVANSKATHCKKGHEYDKENTYITPKGFRDCRECRATSYRNWYSRKREKRIKERPLWSRQTQRS